MNNAMTLSPAARNAFRAGQLARRARQPNVAPRRFELDADTFQDGWGDMDDQINRDGIYAVAHR